MMGTDRASVLVLVFLLSACSGHAGFVIPDSTNVQLWDCSGEEERQQWKVETGNYPDNCVVLMANSTMVLDIEKWSNDSGANVWLHSRSDFQHAYNQQFKYDDSTHHLISLMNGHCVTASSDVIGSNINMQPCQTNNTLQNWILDSQTGRLHLQETPSGCLDAGSTANCSIKPFSTYTYCNPAANIDDRVADLLPRLTVAEKAQFLVAAGHTNGGVPRLGVAPFTYGESLHGVNCRCGAPVEGTTGCATSFPHALGLGATFNRSLWTAVGEIIATEGRALSNQGRIGLAMWAPDINLFRDPRWGRGQEVPSEDPYLNSEYVAHYSRALQEGEDPRYLKLISSCKHFSAYDLENWGGKTRFTFSANVSEQDLVEYYWPPFRACVERAHAKSIMCSLNAVNGVPSCGYALFQNGIVRDEWGFEGYFVSDCGAIGEIASSHHYTNSSEMACKIAIEAGTDTNCGSAYHSTLAKTVNDKLLTEAQVDVSVSRVIRYMFQVGTMDPLEDQPYVRLGPSDVDIAPHRQVALEAAHQMIVLLKNEDNLLPLQMNKIQTVALIGPQANATQTLLSNYHGQNTLVDSHSILHGMMDRADSGVKINYAAGLDDPAATDKSNFSHAVDAAKSSSVAIVCVGLGQDQEREGHDRTDLILPGAQDDLVQEILKVQPKTVVVLVNGGPLAVESIKESVPAIVEAFYPGELGGDAVADVLFGNVNPSGRLPNTVYPADYIKRSFFDMNLRDNGGCTYMHYTGNALWEFGYGLSYTSFNYSWTSDSLGAEGNVYRVHSSLAASVQDTPLVYTVTVKNTGSVGGADSVLGFLKSSSGQSDSPIRELFDFGRVSLEPGESAVVHLTVGPQTLSLTSALGVQSVRSGRYRVEVGDLRAEFEVYGDDSVLFDLPEVKHRFEAKYGKSLN